MKRTIATLTILGLTASGAMAQELSYGTITASVGQLSFDDEKISTQIIAGQLGVAHQGFDAWIAGTNATLSPDGVPIDLSADFSSIGAAYTFQGVRVDASSSDLTLGIGGPALSLGLTEVGVGYDSGSFYGRVSYTMVDDTLITDDVSIFGVHVGYAMSEVARLI